MLRLWLIFIAFYLFAFLSDAWRIRTPSLLDPPFVRHPLRRKLPILRSTNMLSNNEPERLIPADLDQNHEMSKKLSIQSVFSTSLIPIGATLGFLSNPAKLPYRIATSAAGGAIGYFTKRYIDRTINVISEKWLEHSAKALMKDDNWDDPDDEYYNSKQYHWDEYVKKIQPKHVNDLIPDTVTSALRELKFNREKPLTSYTFEELKELGQGKYNQTDKHFKFFQMLLLSNYIYQFTDNEKLNLIQLDSIAKFIDLLHLTGDYRTIGDAITWAACDLGEKLPKDEFGWFSDDFALRNFLQACKLYYLTDKYVNLDTYHGKQCHTALYVFPYDEYKHVLTNACKNTFIQELKKMLLFPFNYTNSDFERLQDICVTNSRQASAFHMNTTMKYFRIHFHQLIHGRIGCSFSNEEFQLRFQSFDEKYSVIQNAIGFWENLEDLTRLTLFKEKELIQFMNLFGYLKNNNQTGFLQEIEIKTLPYYGKYVSDIFAQIHFSYEKMTTFLQNWQLEQEENILYEKKMKKQQEQKDKLKIKSKKSSSSSSSSSSLLLSNQQKNDSSLLLSSLYELNANLLIQKKNDFFISYPKAKEIIIEQVELFNRYSAVYLEKTYEKALLDAKRRKTEPDFQLFYYDLFRYSLEFAEIIRLTKDFFPSYEERMNYLEPLTLERGLPFISEKYLYQIYGLYRLSASFQSSEQQLLQEGREFYDNSSSSSSSSSLLPPPIAELQAIGSTNALADEGYQLEANSLSSSSRTTKATTIQNHQQQKIFDFVFRLSPQKEKEFTKIFSIRILEKWFFDQIDIYDQAFIHCNYPDHPNIKNYTRILHLMNITLFDFFQAAKFNQSEIQEFQLKCYYLYSEKIMNETIKDYYFQEVEPENYYQSPRNHKLYPFSYVQQRILNHQFTQFDIDRCILPKENSMIKLKTLSSFLSIPMEHQENIHYVMFGSSFQKLIEHCLYDNNGMLTSNHTEELEEVRNYLRLTIPYVNDLYNLVNLELTETSLNQCLSLLIDLIKPVYFKYVNPNNLVSKPPPQKEIHPDSIYFNDAAQIQPYAERSMNKILKHFNLICRTDKAIEKQILSRTKEYPSPSLNPHHQSFHTNRIELFKEMNSLIKGLLNNYQLQPWNQTIAQSNHQLIPFRFSDFLNRTVIEDLYTFMMIQKLLCRENQFIHLDKLVPELPPLNTTTNELFELKQEFHQLYEPFKLLLNLSRNENYYRQRNIEITASLYKNYILDALKIHPHDHDNNPHKNHHEVSIKALQQFSILADELYLPMEIRPILQDTILRECIQIYMNWIINHRDNELFSNSSFWKPEFVTTVRKQIESLGYSLIDVMSTQDSRISYLFYGMEAIGLIDQGHYDQLIELNQIYNMTNEHVINDILQQIAYARVSELQNLMLAFSTNQIPTLTMNYTSQLLRYYRFIMDDIETPIEVNGRFYTVADYDRVMLYYSITIDQLKNNLIAAYREYQKEYEMIVNPLNPLIAANTLSLAESIASISSSTAEDSKLSIKSFVLGTAAPGTAPAAAGQALPPPPSTVEALPSSPAEPAGKGKRGRKKKVPETPPAPVPPVTPLPTAATAADSTSSVLDLIETPPKKSPEEMATALSRIEEEYLKKKAVIAEELRVREEEYELLVQLKPRLLFTKQFVEPRMGLSGLLNRVKPFKKLKGLHEVHKE